MRAERDLEEDTKAPSDTTSIRMRRVSSFDRRVRWNFLRYCSQTATIK